jgi:glutamate:GABA antiporter
VVPAHKLSLAAGLMQAFHDFLDQFHLAGFVPVIGLLAALGASASVSTWLLGPAKGIAVAAGQGNLPHIFSRSDQQDVPVNVLILRGIGTSIVVFLFVLVPSINQAYWMLSAMTTQVLAVMYMLIFAAVIRLRAKQPDKERPYRVPGGRLGIWLVAG